jgi:hypothetical protein
MLWDADRLWSRAYGVHMREDSAALLCRSGAGSPRQVYSERTWTVASLCLAAWQSPGTGWV